MGKRHNFDCLKTLSCMIVIELSFLVEVKAYRCDLKLRKPCEDGFTYVEVMDACLKPELNRTEWADAVYACKVRAGALVKVDTQEKAEAVSEFARDNNLPVYWIGLELNSNSKLFEWTFDRAELKKGMYQPFKNSKDRNGTNLCVLSNVGQTVEWTYTDCSNRHQSICHVDSAYMPKRPTVTFISHDLASTLFNGGEELEFECAADLNRKGYLRLVLLTKSGFEIFEITKEYYDYFEENQSRESGKCNRVAHLQIQLEVTPDLHGKTLACVSFMEAKNSQICRKMADPYCLIVGPINFKDAPPLDTESTSQPPQLTMGLTSPAPVIGTRPSPLQPHRPTITKTSYDKTDDTLLKGSELTATCTAELCDEGNLKFVLISENGSAETIDVKHVRYREYIDRDSDEGCNTKGVATLSTTVTSHLHGKTLACLSFTDTSIKACSKEDKYCTVLGTINVREGVMPQRPRIIIKGYNLRKHNIEEGSQIVAICEALLCDKGHLSFVFLAGDIALPLNYPDEHVFYAQNLPYKITETCVRRGIGRLTLKVTKEFRGLTLACVSYMNKTTVTCSSQDPYCAVAGKINIDTDQPGNAFTIICVIWFLVSPKDHEIEEEIGQETEKSRSGEDRERIEQDVSSDFDTVPGSEHMSEQMSALKLDIEKQSNVYIIKTAKHRDIMLI